MSDDLYFGGVAIFGGGVVILVLAWLIGVQGRLELISNYRAHPERYPDGDGLGRWMAVTLASGGLAFCGLGVAAMTRRIGEEIAFGAIVTSTGLVIGALSGLARYHRKPPPGSPTGREVRHGRPARPGFRR